MQKQTLVILVLAVLAACSSPEPEPLRLTIVVIGDGVVDNKTSRHMPTRSSPVRPLPLNRAQGLAMLRGVRAALDDPSVRDVASLFDLVTHDDLGDLEEADRLARQIAGDPRTLLVIGHATSGTTRVAAQHYDDAGIPLIMPIAT